MTDQGPLDVTVRLDPEEDAGLHRALVDLVPEDRADRMMQWARLGHLVMSMARVAPGREAMSEYFSEFTHQTNALKETIEEHVRLFRQKTTRSDGDLGEQFVRERLFDAFGGGGDTFEVWSDTGHQGDVIGRMAVPNAPPRRVLIEVKDYTGAVKSKEVDKFRKDLRENPDVIAGLFISLRSSIENKPGMVHIEVEDGRPAIYIAQEAPGQQIFVMAWSVLRMMLATKTIPAAPGLTDLASASALRIHAEVDAFVEANSANVSRIEDIRRNATSISKAADEIKDEAVRLEADLTSQAKHLGRILANEARTLASGTQAPPVPVPWSEDQWLDGFEKVGTSLDIHQANLVALHRWLCGVPGVTGEWTEKGIKLFVNGTERFEITVLSTGLRFVIPETLVDQLGLEYAWEKDKVGQVRFTKGKSVTLDPTPLMAAREAPTQTR